MRSLQVSPEEFSHLADNMTRLAVEWLRELDTRDIKPHTSGGEISRVFDVPCPEAAEGEGALRQLGDVLEHSRAQNGRFFGYILGSAEPAAAAADLLASVINQASTAWRSSPTAITIERVVVRLLSEALGCADFIGSLCGGGSLANLM